MEIHNNPEWIAAVKGLLPKDPPPIKALSSVLEASNLESLKDYIECGIDVNHKLPDRGDNSLLMYALIKYNNMRSEASLAVLKYLLEKGADRNDVLKILDSGKIPYQEGEKESIVPQMKDLFKEYDN